MKRLILAVLVAAIPSLHLAATGGQAPVAPAPAGSDASLPVTRIEGNIVSPEIENPNAISPAPFMAALAIQR